MFVVGGESLIDLVSEPVGPDGVVRMTAHQGGSPYNCAIALARLDNEAGFLCPISRDGFGAYLLGPLAAAGVVPLLAERVATPSTLAVVTLDERGKAQYEFYRGAERAFTEAALISALPARIEAYQIGGFCAIEPEDARVWLAVAGEAARRGATLSIDPNVRPSLIADFAGYRQRLAALLDVAHIVKVSIEDLMALESSMSVDAHVAALLSRPNCELVIVTFGEDGSRAWSRRASGEAGIYPPPEFGDTVGAGDSLMAGVLTHLSETGDLAPGRLAGLDAEALTKMLRFGAVVAGLNCGHTGCNPPSRGEVEAVLDFPD
jgi:fructokinase